MTCQDFRNIASPRLIFLSIIITLLTSLPSCRSSRSGTVTGIGYEREPSQPLSQKELKELFGLLESSYQPWESVKMPVTLNLNSPKSVSISGTLSMQRDRSIHMSFRFFGMEVATLMVTDDSIFASYKLERIYFAESIRDLLGGFPATVGNVQDLLLGRPFIIGEETPTLSRCSLDGNGTTWTITPDFSPAGIGYGFTVDTPTGNVELLTVNLPSRAPITAAYSDFAVTATGPMAGTSFISARGSSAKFEGEIDLNPRKAEWGQGFGKEWTVPKGYTRVRAEEIMKKLTKK
ncbi:MAG: DUF4292 domain-containing protein [Bacteroides sp.]|nr:DUF4292 domain-containing protein [Bacteroides sp.]